MIYICPNNLLLWQSMIKPQQTNEHMREVINYSTYTHLLNIIKSILTQTLEKLCKKRVHDKEDFDKLYFWNTINKIHQGILVWNKNKRLHTRYKKHVHKERKETTHVKIGERTVITTSSYIYNHKYKVCYLMMPKNHQWATQSLHAWNDTCIIKRQDLIESTGVVLAKYLPKVKLESFTTLECQSWVELCVPVFWGSLGFYSSVESNSYACATSLFHIGKIFINGRIFQNLFRIRILFTLGFYGLGLIMRRKSFSFKISWRPHNDQFSATWPFGPSTPVHSIGSVHFWPTYLDLSSPSKWTRHL